MSPINRDGVDFGHDDRYKRRLKRKSFDTGACESDSWIHKLKGALQNGGLGDGVVDADYNIFLSCLCGSNEFESSTLEDETGDETNTREAEEDTNDGINEDADPQYKMFLENLKENGKAYALEVPKDNGMLEVLVYEAEHEPEERYPQTKRKLRNFRKGKKKIVTDGEKIDARKHLRRNVRTKDKIEQPKDSGRVLQKEGNSVIAKHLRAERVNPVSHEVTRALTLKPSQEDTHMHETAERSDREDSVTDRCYQSFLDGIQMEGDSVVFVVDSGKRFKYEDDDAGNYSDMEIWETERAPDGGKGEVTPSEVPRISDSPMEGDDLQCLGTRIDQSQFREKLMDILRMPYDQEEFDELLQEVNVRKPMGGYRDLRGRMKTFSSDKSSKSYLDHHNDVKVKLDSARFDRPKMLNILRGFFYWLRNVSQVGVFMPWKDHSCLTVMPGSR